MNRIYKEPYKNIRTNLSDNPRQFALALSACLLLCACAEREPLSSDRLIKLGARPALPTGRSTRASVNDLAGLAAVGDQVGVYGVVSGRADALHATLTTEWETTPLMNNVRTTKIDATTGMLFWEGEYTYPIEEDKKVKFCVYHPYAPVASGGANSDNYVESVPGKSPVLHFKLTGAEDLMWVRPVVGSHRHPPSVLLFEHKLTQLRFRLIDEEGEFTGVQIASLHFEGVNTASSLNLETGELGGWSAPSDAVAFPLKSPVTITGTVETPQVLAGEVMLQPEQPLFRLTLKTDSRGDYPGIEIRPSGGETTFTAGRSYLVTLRFLGRTAIAASAQVVPWVMDGYGEGVVD